MRTFFDFGSRLLFYASALILLLVFIGGLILARLWLMGHP